ncbi:hypothetical protein GMA8713_01119 [Grimontia marina]|uniref:Uncharacterized protein n=1 Tax=Grimontia marina TaxID=646534 RepID=A0A128EYX6_9GAMM|nr:hypothetical protein GMA8713_01119 [Grimontia marina]
MNTRYFCSTRACNYYVAGFFFVFDCKSIFEIPPKLFVSILFIME